MPQSVEDSHSWRERLRGLRPTPRAHVLMGLVPPAADIEASVFATVSQWKDFRRFRALCEAIGFKPPEGANEAKAAAWWLCLLEQPEDYHDKLWRLFADYIERMRQRLAETEKALSVTEWALTKTTPLLEKWFIRKDTLIARQAEKVQQLEDRVRSLARQVRPRHRKTFPLTPDAAAVLELLKYVPKGRAMTGPKILDALAELDPPRILDQSVLTRRIIPLLKKHYGVRNKPRVGYYIASRQ